MTRDTEKATLKNKGWSYRTAATELGVTYQHLCLVLNGRRHSRRLMAKVRALPPNPKSSILNPQPSISPRH